MAERGEVSVILSNGEKMKVEIYYSAKSDNFCLIFQGVDVITELHLPRLSAVNLADAIKLMVER